MTVPWPQIEAAALARRVGGLAAGERLTILGIGRDEIGAILADRPDPMRGALLVACRGLLSAPAILDRLLDDLAELALARWPRWAEPDAAPPAWEAQSPGADLTPSASGSACIAAPGSGPWRKAAEERARLGLAPRFPRMARELEFAHLLRTIGSSGVLLVWEVDPASGDRARPVIEALEWGARHGAAAVAALAVPPPAVAPYDRLLYGAFELVRPQATAGERFIAPLPGAHHASASERRVAAALAQDADLLGLFACNALVPVGTWGVQHRVDLLCSAYRVVVELDGPEHRAESKFGADRHRDYELLTAGYLVLRLTNEQVAADLALAIEKIRAVVDLRRRRQEDDP
ncbi:endonuclease domain-containing protein [Methylobacterium sp. M6A4_1b]